MGRSVVPDDGEAGDPTMGLVRRPRSPPWIPMPSKFAESRGHKIPRARYRVTNWPKYDAALAQRGSITVWFTGGIRGRTACAGDRRGQPICSVIAIQTGLALRLVCHQPLRQTEGLLRSIVDVLGISVAMPDHATLSRRGGGLMILPKHVDHSEPLHLIVDSTGLKIYGEGEWLDQKHGIRSRRRWCKLHLGMDADTHEIVSVELTPDDVGDVTEIPHLLDQIDADVASMPADGAYDGEAVYDAVAERHPGVLIIGGNPRRSLDAELKRLDVSAWNRRAQPAMTRVVPTLSPSESDADGPARRRRLPQILPVKDRDGHGAEVEVVEQTGVHADPRFVGIGDASRKIGGLALGGAAANGAMVMPDCIRIPLVRRNAVARRRQLKLIRRAVGVQRPTLRTK
jgi:hypothetical protein